jgi:Rrf2 family protein
MRGEAEERAQSCAVEIWPVKARSGRRCSVTIVSRGADYAIRAMLDVASQAEGSRTVTEQIAQRQEIPGAFLSKVVAQLTQSGLLRTQRGASGGVFLGRAAQEISLWQVVEAVQGPVVLNLCTGPYDGCSRAHTCPAHPLFRQAQQSLAEVLDKATLAEIAAEGEILTRGQGE